jgi:hypothetical protein
MSKKEELKLIPNEVDKDWLAMDIARSPQKYPQYCRNLHISGAQCSLWGRSVTDMDSNQLILFIGYLNKLYSNTRALLNTVEGDVVNEAI